MSRSSLVAMLIAVEIAIVGIAVYAVRGAHSLHNADFVAKTIAPIDAGAFRRASPSPMWIRTSSSPCPPTGWCTSRI